MMVQEDEMNGILSEYHEIPQERLFVIRGVVQVNVHRGRKMQ
jgi:hypothetical protein